MQDRAGEIGGRAVVGPALVEIGLAAVHKFELRQLARPHLEELAAVTGETVHVNGGLHIAG